MIESLSSTDIIDSIKLKSYNDFREIYITGEIDEDVELIVNKMFDNLIFMDKQLGSYDPIIIKISSPGGYISSGLSIVSKIEEAKKLGYQVICIAYGLCMSVATLIFVSGSRRICQKHTQFLIHEPRAFDQGINTVETYKRSLKDLEDSWVRAKDIIKRYSNIREKTLKELSDSDKEYYMWAEEAKKLGMVDVILGE